MVALYWTSLLSKVPWVPQVPECPSARVFKCPLSARVPKWLSAQVPKFLECLSAQVPFDSRVSRVSKCTSALSARVPFDCLKRSRSRVPSVPWVPKCFSQSVSQSASQSVGLWCWFSKLTPTSRALTLREDKILRRRKLATVVWSNFSQS